MNVRILAVKGCLDTVRSLRLLPDVSTMSQRCFQSTQPVVAAKMPYRVKVSAGKRYAWCACGHSQKQPFCDGAHRTKAPSIAPLRFTPDKDMAVMLCACKQTHNAPYCDGTHFKVIFRGLCVRETAKQVNNMSSMTVSTTMRPWIISTLRLSMATSKIQYSTRPPEEPVIASKTPFKVELIAGKRYSWCTCGHSKKQPFCDGSHKFDDRRSKPLRFVPEKDMTVWLCGCKYTNTPPYCDGTHKQDFVKLAPQRDQTLEDP